MNAIVNRPTSPPSALLRLCACALKFSACLIAGCAVEPRAPNPSPAASHVETPARPDEAISKQLAELLAEIKQWREELKAAQPRSSPSPSTGEGRGGGDVARHTDTRSDKAPVRSEVTPPPWTGALIHIARGNHCVPCHRLKSDLYEYVKGTGWRIGDSPQDHWRFVDHDDDTPVPYVEYIRDGRVSSRITGYLGDIEQIIRAHPRAAKQGANR